MKGPGSGTRPGGKPSLLRPLPRVFSEWMKRFQLASPGSLARLVKAADEAWKVRDFQQHIEILERIIRLDPANVRVLLQLGRVCGLAYHYAAAERYLEKAIRLVANKTDILAAAGLQCRDFRNPDLAIRYFERAAAQRDASAEIVAELAELYARVRRQAEALKSAARALSMNGECAQALLASARLQREAGRLEQAESLLRSSLTKVERNVEVTIRAHYELGTVLDRQGRYDEAMDAFLQAKTRMRPLAAPHVPRLASLRARLQATAAEMSPEILQRWSASSHELEPARKLALLGGHPRSGTTLLEQVLDSHPDIVSAEEAESFHDYAYAPLARTRPQNAYTLPVLDLAQPAALRQSRENYFRAVELMLGQPVGRRLLIDKHPSLTFLVPALLRVFPEIKLLITLRDPRDVCLSCFMQPFVPISQTTSAYLTLAGTVQEYCAMMSIWRTLSPLLIGRYLEVRYEDMVEDLESVSRRVLDFLAVPWDTRVLAFHEHARQKVIHSPSYADVARPVFKHAMGRWRNYGKYLEPYLEQLRPFVKSFGYVD